MASIRREAIIEASADLVWDAVRDVGQVHKRVVPGFLTDCRMEEGTRVDWAARNERLEHHNASLQVFDIDGLASCRVVWIADVLPHAAAQVVGGLMDEGLACMRKTLGSHSGA